MTLCWMFSLVLFCIYIDFYKSYLDRIALCGLTHGFLYVFATKLAAIVYLPSYVLCVACIGVCNRWTAGKMRWSFDMCCHTHSLFCSFSYCWCHVALCAVQSSWTQHIVMSSNWSTSLVVWPNF